MVWIVLAVREVVGEAVKRARQGKGPSLIECKTYRFEGHWVGDPIVYRSKEELNEWKKKDPILNFKKHLLERNILNKEEQDRIALQAQEEIKEAVEFAKKSPFPNTSDAKEYVYCP